MEVYQLGKPIILKQIQFIFNQQKKVVLKLIFNKIGLPTNKLC